MLDPNTTRFKRADATPSRLVDDEAIVVQSREGMVNVLNPVGTRIWELCASTPTVAEIADTIATEYDIPADEARTDVIAFLEDMRDKGLIGLA